MIWEEERVFLVFEHMDTSFCDYLSLNGPLGEWKVRSFAAQILTGLAHIHRKGYMHRDLKPENLLLTGGVVKLCDFGLSREVDNTKPCTDYVSTRWYRAPEMLLRSANYGAQVDVWATAVIVAEALAGQPLFPGKDSISQRPNVDYCHDLFLSSLIMKSLPTISSRRIDRNRPAQ